MRIIEDGTVTLKRVRFRFERSRICINGHRTWFTVDGIKLEKAIQIGSRYLLFVSTNEGDINWAKSCDIYLINQSGRILEEKIIRFDSENSVYYNDYNYWEDYDCWDLGRFNLIPPNMITFNFDGMIYSIEVLDKPVYPWSDYYKNNKNDNFDYFAGGILSLFRNRLQIKIIQQKLDISNYISK
ncbi:unnamed protein product [Commensalibacter communis]|uniref:hypothetical protein n=1 Tax=Commensalibacter communis TaxID=2972786 RepID=UPI0022FF80E2|nr:hypothetical protein [Commensalibacter communis]CAI3950866.1 unnamed protein product [Commensalibacter communis]CAI3953523.1 unnamed protein product [Commensalibacter communis]